MSFSFAGSSTPNLRDVDLTINSGDRVLISGPSGGGKTTLGNLLAGLRSPTTGTVRHGHRPPVLVSQFGEHHLYQAPLAFNRTGTSGSDLAEHPYSARILCVMGRRPSLAHWHHERLDLADGDTLC
jgi:energy-coupling factor transporter ATP-binding protein EcfA2